MLNKEKMQLLFATIKSWATDNTNRYILAPIPKSQTDQNYDDSPLVPQKSYFRIWLKEMYLEKSKKWFTNLYPAVHSSVNLTMAGWGTQDLSHVAQVPPESQGKGVFVNYNLTNLLPFMGGLVGLQSALLVMQGDNSLQASIGVLQDFASLVAPPISQAITIAEKVSSGLQDLISTSNGKVNIAMHQIFASGNGGTKALKPGYLALILATASQVDVSQLSVVNDTLHYKGAAMTGYDYCLYFIEGRQERDDWRFKEIDEAMNKAMEAYLEFREADGKANTSVAQIKAVQSPFLTPLDKRRVVKAIKDELAAYASGGQGAVAFKSLEAETDSVLTSVMSSRAMSLEDAEHEGEITLEEVMSNL